MATWEIDDGKRLIGPRSEGDVVRMIADGLPAAAVVRRTGTEAWQELGSHPPFAGALERASYVEVDEDVEVEEAPAGAPRRAVVEQQAPAPAPVKPEKAKTKTSSIVLALVFGLVLFATLMSTSKNHSSAPTLAPVAAPQPVAEEPNMVDLILAKPTAREAFAAARPMMVDRFNASSVGSGVFAAWAINKLRWSDVAVVNDETSYARVRKDVDAERGKRLCVPGLLRQISVQRTKVGTAYDALLVSEAGNIFNITAVKSTGDLVQGSAARFCGVVTGIYDYSNTGGGTSQAIDMVGMFDLPENKR